MSGAVERVGQDQWSRWQAAVAGRKLDLGERGDPPSGFFRRSVGQGRWEAFSVFREDDGRPQCIRNMFGDGSKLSALEIDELFAGDVYAVPYPIYKAVAEEGQPWPEIYTTRLTTAEIKAGAVWTEELAKNKLAAVEMAKKPAEAEIGHNSSKAAPHELLKGRINDLSDERRAWLKEIGGEVKTQEHADKAADFKNAFDALEKEATDTHRTEKKPHLDAGRDVDARWKPIGDLAMAAKRDCASMVTPYLRAQEAAAREAVAKAAAEARSRQEGAPAPVEPVKPRAGNGGRGVSLRTVSRAVVTDLPALAAYLAGMEAPPPDFADVCRRLADKMLRAAVKVPGAEMVESKEAA